MKTNTTIHATCVDIEGKGVLIKGQSGSGKSSLALQLMAIGASLVSDDRTILVNVEGTLIASAPSSIRNLIEARGIGILNAKSLIQSEVHCVIDLDQLERERLPKERKVTLLGIELPLLLRVDGLHFAPGVDLFVRQGRSTR